LGNSITFTKIAEQIWSVEIANDFIYAGDEKGHVYKIKITGEKLETLTKEKFIAIL